MIDLKGVYEIMQGSKVYVLDTISLLGAMNEVLDLMDCDEVYRLRDLVLVDLGVIEVEVNG
jgi:hypothetical protein